MFLADAAAEAGGVSGVLIVAIFGFLGVTVAPIALAIINRGGKSKDVAPEVAVPRQEYDALLEQLSRLDDENDRLGRENARLTDELRTETTARLRAELRLEEARRG